MQCPLIQVIPLYLQDLQDRFEEYIADQELIRQIRIMKKYILVSFPEIQDFMEHPRWSECVFCIEIDGHPCEDSTFAVPEDLYNEVFKV